MVVYIKNKLIKVKDDKIIFIKFCNIVNKEKAFQNFIGVLKKYYIIRLFQIIKYFIIHPYIN